MKADEIVSGVLCRDNGYWMGTSVCLAVDAKRHDVEKCNGIWVPRHEGKPISWIYWEVDEFVDLYGKEDLPKIGASKYVQLEYKKAKALHVADEQRQSGEMNGAVEQRRRRVLLRGAKA